MTAKERRVVSPKPSQKLISPYGDELVDLMATGETLKDLLDERSTLTQWSLAKHQLADIEMLLTGAYSPLTGYLTQANYESVCHRERLVDNVFWPIPIVLDVTEQFAGQISPGERISLLHPEGMTLAVMTVSDIWKPDIERKAQSMHGTTDHDPPGFASFFRRAGSWYLGGQIQGIETPSHHGFHQLQSTPAELRQEFRRRAISNIAALQAKFILHRFDIESIRLAVSAESTHLLINALVDTGNPDNLKTLTEIRCHQAVMEEFRTGDATLKILPRSQRTTGPKELALQAIIVRNLGANILILPPIRDDAETSRRKAHNESMPVDSELRETVEREIGVRLVELDELVYLPESKQYRLRSEVSASGSAAALSDTELRELLDRGGDVPEYFSSPSVISILRDAYPARHKQGFAVLFTGLPSSGKSTVARTLMRILHANVARPITLLDGDIVRHHLSSELGFSKEHRDLNVTRIGYVASEIVKHRGIAICAPIAPYADARQQVRDMTTQFGGFVEVHVSTPIEVCESRDRKGLYAKARAGVIKDFTGVSDRYEIPEQSEVTIDTSDSTPEQAALRVVDYLVREGYVQWQGR